MNRMEDHSQSPLKLSTGVISPFSALFSEDSKLVFVVCDKIVRVVSRHTGNFIKSLCGHDDAITAIILNPSNPLQLITCSLDHTIKLWDYNDGICIRTFHLASPILSMKATKKCPHSLFLLLHVLQSKHKRSELSVCHFDLQSRQLQESLFSLKGEPPFCFDVCGVANDQVAIAISCGTSLYVWQADKLIHHSVSSPITAIACHPNLPIVATGHEKGFIYHWHCLSTCGDDKEARNPFEVSTRLHWHAHSVSALTFSHDGNYMYSGGEEAVLVIWQLGTLQKNFLPRLGSEIYAVSISPDSKLYGITCKDNAVRLIHAIDMEGHKMIRGIAIARYFPEFHEQIRRGLTTDPRTGCVVLNSTPGSGSLQFFNAIEDKHVMEVEICPQNHISRIKNEKIHHRIIEHVAFTGDGLWMATVDNRDDGETSRSTALKFWQYIESDQAYHLNTRVENPHRVVITSFASNPVHKLFATGSDDGVFKTWELQERDPDPSMTAATQQTLIWTCKSAGIYRQCPCQCVRFSQDGSMLAVAYQQIITLWDPFTNTLLHTLSDSPPQHPIRTIEFIPFSPFLVTCTDCDIHVWDLTSCDVSWSYTGQVVCMAVDNFVQPSQFAVCFAVSHSDVSFTQFVVLFRLDDPKPVFSWYTKNVLSLVFLQEKTQNKSSGHSSRLIGLTESCDLLLFSKEQDEEIQDNEENSKENGSIEPFAKASAFEQIYGFSRARTDGSKLTKRGNLRVKSSVQDIFSAPVHVLPPPNIMLNSYLEMSSQKMNIHSKKQKEQDSKDDQASEQIVQQVDKVAPTEIQEHFSLPKFMLELQKSKNVSTFFEQTVGNSVEKLLHELLEKSVSIQISNSKEKRKTREEGEKESYTKSNQRVASKRQRLQSEKSNASNGIHFSETTDFLTKDDQSSQRGTDLSEKMHVNGHVNYHSIDSFENQNGNETPAKGRPRKAVTEKSRRTSRIRVTRSNSPPI